MAEDLDCSEGGDGVDDDVEDEAGVEWYSEELGD